MNLIIVMKLITAILQVLDPVETCILNLWRKVLLYSTLHISCDCTWIDHATDILLEIA